MRWLFKARLRLRSLFAWSAVEQDIEDELQYHVERQTEANLAAGMNEREARRAALRLLGGMTRPKEECRDAHRASWGMRLLDTLMRDGKHALRRLVHDWQFALAAILITGLGIGINSAAFSAVNALVFTATSSAEAERLVSLYQNVGERAEPAGVSYPAYGDLAAATAAFSTVAAILPGTADYEGQLVFAEYVTANYLKMAGHQVFAGRWFTGDEDRLGSAPAIVIGYRAWQTRFGSDYRILGQTIRVNQVPVTVVGIGPAQLASASHPALSADFWLPVAALNTVGSRHQLPDLLTRRGQLAFEVRARLQPGVRVNQAQAMMNVLGQRLAQDYPETDPGKGITVVRTDSVVIHPGEQDLWVKLMSITLLITVGLVLTIACSNLATLLLVRGTSRAKEVAVRLALGATRSQLIRYLLTESVLLSLGGALAGLVLCYWTLHSIAAIIPFSLQLRMDHRVLAFTFALSLLTGITMGLAPALRSTRLDLLPALRKDAAATEFSPGQRWFTLKNILLTTQIAGSFFLLMGTAFMVRMVASARWQEPGFAVQGVALASLDTHLAGYSEAAAARIHSELLRRISAVPGVQAVFSSAGTPVGSHVSREIELDGSPGSEAARWQGKLAWAAPGYFETLQIPVLYGRPFRETDGPGRPLVAIVSESLARRVFGTTNAIGRRFRYGDVERSQEAKTAVEIVGVVRDAEGASPGGGGPAVFYLPAAQTSAPATTLVARSSGSATALVQAIQRELRTLDPTLPARVRTMEQQLDEDLRLWRWALGVVGGMSVVALALAAIGLYAVVRFAVAQRSFEFGIRVALGAGRHQIVWLVMREITILIGASLVAGMAISVVGLRLASSLIEAPSTVHLEALPGVTPLTLLSVAGVLALAAGAAAYFPARQAANGDPSVSLRQQ
ncbi:MAG: ABC transporter permease [Acidobacteria bacterium]|nr:ABC transporter permease [Acidobacteriota bacterium]